MVRRALGTSLLLVDFGSILTEDAYSISFSSRRSLARLREVKFSWANSACQDGCGMGAQGLVLPGKLSNIKVVLNGGQRVTLLRPDGYFSFHNVPAGTHLIEVDAIGYFFSPVRVDVSARNPGKVQATMTENRRDLSELVLDPLREEQYYEIREPFSIMSVVKSPMGLMTGFMLVVVFLMPKLMENIDPEEMRRAQEEMRSQGVPSLASLLPGGAARS
ncbi:ER membrane protein complex subunit 7 homolog isoform X1 [Juglans microcarpa x Juglans regia]|uniref:ER membrane protein complex subunit 7 homolog isoform X1 n=1 Tax=Juglans microcarpa x Juglans regia TaxID=2249226 RepID=UPI001B7E4484|nr:ER membrane protein complex subunit 7 homolog isoform X1 [Juglans microcarpa x Juglans regia]